MDVYFRTENVLEHALVLQFHTPQYQCCTQFHLLVACVFALCDSVAQKDKGYLNDFPLTELFVYTIQMNKFNLRCLI